VTGWLKRNMVALVAVAVLAPTTVAVTFSTEWNTFLSTRASEPVEVAEGLAARFDGAEWRVAGSERISAESREGTDAGLPAGSDLIVVTIEVTPGDLSADEESSSCTVRLGEYEGTGDTPRRSWGDATFAAIDYRAPEGAETGCSPDITDPYTMTSTFVVASDASDNLGVQLEVADQLPRYLLLRL
jgi:hypothetical protein